MRALELLTIAAAEMKAATSHAILNGAYRPGERPNQRRNTRQAEWNSDFVGRRSASRRYVPGVRGERSIRSVRTARRDSTTKPLRIPRMIPRQRLPPRAARVSPNLSKQIAPIR